MNSVYLIGNLTEDPKTSVTAGGATKCTFRLAVTRKFTNQQGEREADFLNIVAWRKLGENCGKYLRKGRKCAVIGSIQTRSYDAKDGSGKRYVAEIIAEYVEFLGVKPQDATGSGQVYERQADNGCTDVTDEDLPY